jgi:Tfp pilus assembly protein PilF
MRHVVVGMLCAGSMLALTACNKGGPSDEEVARAVKDINVIDESGLNDVMLNAGDPNEAVAYFARTLQANPERTDLKRGLASSLVRAKKNAEGAVAWKAVVDSADATNDDRVEYADALIRNNQWPDAEAVLATIPPTHETFKRYRLEAMIADSHKDWKKADSFYEIAIGLTTTPSNVLNNWGFSKLSRGDFPGAEKLFNEALVHDGSLFTAKNNLVLARAAQRNYELPAVQMTQVERAELLYTMALSAVKQGDIQTGKSLLNNAIETHPQHFDAAVRALSAIENGQTPT